MADKPNSKANSKPISIKRWVATAMFAAIIVVFALWGIHPERWESSAGGVAAVVNNESISIAEFRQRVQNQMAQARGIENLPAAQRQRIEDRVRAQVLNEMVFGELMFQAGHQKGFNAVDAEVRDYILSIDFLKENGRFVRERYESLLSQLRSTPDQFEKSIRKQLVGQKLQELLVGSMQPSSLEVDHFENLRDNKIKIRYAVLTRDDLKKKGFVADADVSAFLNSSEGKAEIEKYYKENKVQFETAEQVSARHILIAVNETRKDGEALKLATEVKAKANAQNFAKLAAQYSDDPGSKAKGGSLDTFSRGRMIPQFEKVAFELPAGQVSAPTKTEYGYHIILVDKKIPATTQSLEQVREEIARNLVSRTKTAGILERMNTQLKSNPKEVESTLSQAGIKFQESAEFDLTTPAIPALGDKPALMGAIASANGKTGWLPKVIDTGDQFILANVTSWKVSRNETGNLESLRRSLNYKKAGQLMEAWAKEAESKSKIVRNDRVLQ